LYQQRLAEHAYALKQSAVFASERVAAYSEFRSRIARLLPLVPSERIAQLRRIDTDAQTYNRIGVELMARIDAGDAQGAVRFNERSAQPRYAALSAQVASLVRSFTRRTMQLNAEGLRREAYLKNAAGAVLALGLAFVAGLLLLLEHYRRKAERALAQRVSSLQTALRTDALTDLPNERALHEQIAKLPESARVALLLLDIDDFKAVNEARGAEYGDRLIETLASALTRARDGSMVYRVTGDRFALLWDVSGGLHARTAAERAWRAGLRTLGGITISAGYCEAVLGDLEAGMLESAEAALRSGKRKGGNTFIEFGAESGAFVLSRAKAHAVRHILRQDSIAMSFQPIVDTISGKTLAYEALARPDHEYGLHGPEEMFDIAERLYKHFELDDLCVRSALRCAEERPTALMFLNVVPASLESDRLDIDRCMRDMGKAGCSPANVVLELTERKIGNVNALARRMDELRSRGFRLALDDTGAGYAGLDVLSKMSFDFVKLDRSLIVRAMQDERARGVLCGVLAIAEETGSTVIAEGIETPAMFDFVREFRSRFLSAPISAMQGYLFGAPDAIA
jgi:diguanylate cyclase (GGDEF)-like protein